MWLPTALLPLWFLFLPRLVLVLAGGGPGVREGGATAAADTVSEQLVAVLHLRREDLPHALRGEIFPVARIRDGTYEEALTSGPNPLTGDSERTGPLPATPLDTFRDFTVYDQGSPIGRFSVDRVEPAVYSCSAVLVGLGEMTLPDPYIRFGRFDPRVRSLAVSGQGVRYEYTLNYYVALGRPVSQEGFQANSALDPEAVSRLRAAIWTGGVAALSEYGAGPWQPGARWEEPRWDSEEGFQLFDLDRDGRLEAAGVLEAIVSEVGPPPDGGLASRQFVATAIVWVADRGPDRRPEVLLVLRQARDTRHWDFGHHLAEVMDLDGDGRAEAFYQVEASEYYGFEIYTLDEGRLAEVFRGAAYGC